MLQRKIQKGFFLITMSLILLSNSILAFAVSSQYYGNNPLYLQPGESVEMFFTLQNLASTEDVRLQATVTEGEDIIELTDSSEIYDVPSGEKTKVNFYMCMAEITLDFVQSDITHNLRKGDFYSYVQQ